MSEKTFTLEEINETTNEIFLGYFEHYKADRMSFSEYTLVENLIMKIQYSFKEKIEEQFKNNIEENEDTVKED